MQGCCSALGSNSAASRVPSPFYKVLGLQSQEVRPGVVGLLRWNQRRFVSREVNLMQTTAKWATIASLASILLFTSSPLSAALRSKASVPVRMKSHSTQVMHARAGKSAGRTKSMRSSSRRFRGQQAIDQERTLQIQQALIREHYLSGVPTGEWDQATREAFVRLQADNNWQTKVVPDSRALIKLGLGPSAENLLNPESAAIATAQPRVNASAGVGAN